MAASPKILKGAADALADKMASELKEVVGVSIDSPFGGLVPFGKRSAFPHAVPSKDHPGFEERDQAAVRARAKDSREGNFPLFFEHI
jgi:hypothetical protein